ncbi:MAG: DUF2269 family protein [Magnetospirillum sp. WYHS-4]
MITKTLKVLHLLGLAMFLGSILGHIAQGFVPGSASDPAAMLIGRQAIEVATRGLTLPGLGLLALSGLALAIRGRLHPARQRWLALHALALPLIALSAFTVMLPTAAALLEAARAGDIGGFAALKGRESAFGALNLLLAVAAVVLGVVKPSLGRKEG